MFKVVTSPQQTDRREASNCIYIRIYSKRVSYDKYTVGSLVEINIQRASVTDKDLCISVDFFFSPTTLCAGNSF